MSADIEREGGGAVSSLMIIAEAEFVPMFALVGDERITEKVSSVSISVSPLT